LPGVSVCGEGGGGLWAGGGVGRLVTPHPGPLPSPHPTLSRKRERDLFCPGRGGKDRSPRPQRDRAKDCRAGLSAYRRFCRTPPGTSGWPRRCLGKVDQRTQGGVYRIIVRERLGDLRIEDHDVGRRGDTSGVLAAHHLSEVRPLVLGSEFTPLGTSFLHRYSVRIWLQYVH
jgi:hypothetical protein